MKIFKFVGSVKPKIKQVNKLKRVEFATKYLDWGIEEWNRIIYCDEVSIELFKNYQDKIWRRRGDTGHPKYYKPLNRVFVKKYRKYFAYFARDLPGELIPISGRMNSQKYCKILEQIKQKIDNFDDYTIQEDNDSTHSSAYSTRFKRLNRIKCLSMEFYD